MAQEAQHAPQVPQSQVVKIDYGYTNELVQLRFSIPLTVLALSEQQVDGMIAHLQEAKAKMIELRGAH